MNGEDVFRQTCNNCHGKGHYEAPHSGDKKRWKRLIGKAKILPGMTSSLPAKND